MGYVLYELIDLQPARRHFEDALALAQANHSQLWIEFSVSMLVRVLVAQGEPEQAGVILQVCYQARERPQSLGQRMVWRAAAEHALALGEAERALDVVEQLLAYTLEEEAFEPEMPFGLHVLRGHAFAALGRTAEAQALLQAARKTADQYYASSSRWRVHAELARRLEK